MKSSYDPEVDAIAIQWSTTPIAESDEVEQGIILDYDDQGNVLGIEILNASKKIQNFPQSVTTTIRQPA